MPVASLTELVSKLAPPRVIWLMVPAGAPVDALLFGADGAPGLDALLFAGRHRHRRRELLYRDAAPRAERLAERGSRYLDCGTSCGPAGARNGATLMVGGARDAFDAVEPMFADFATPGGYCFFEGHGAGHFVKMVQNGIEYGMMRAIAEGSRCCTPRRSRWTSRRSPICTSTGA